MRDYGKVSPKFWTASKTGRALRKSGPEAVIVAMYLMTSPHSNMLGVYHQPVLYMAHETGLGIEGASKGLQSCIEVGFCSFDEASDMVWVHEMALYQVASELKATDKRCAGIQKDYDALPDCAFLGAFFDRYASVFHLKRKRHGESEIGSLEQAPSEPLTKPLRSQEQEQEQEQEKGAYALVGDADDAKTLPRCQAESVVSLYHEVLPEMPRVKLMTDSRRKAIGKFWRWVLTSKKSDGQPRAQTADQALTWVRGYFTRTRDNDFLMGRTPQRPGHEAWRCDLDFLLTERGMKHVIEKTAETA